MIIGVIGSGGREHAICAKILESKKISNRIIMQHRGFHKISQK